MTPADRRRAPRCDPWSRAYLRAVAAGVVFIAMMFTAPGAVAAARTWLHADRGTPEVKLRAGSKSRTYYRFTSADPAHVTVTGPVKLRLSVRLNFVAGMPATRTCVVEVREGANLLARHAAKTRRSRERFTGRTSAVPGRLLTMTVDVPPGRHTLAITLARPTGASACARFSIPGRHRATHYVAITPLDARETYTALAAEKQIAYYGVDTEHPLSVRVVGPARLRILSRLNFDFALHGERRYTLEIIQDGKTLRQELLVTTRSTSVPYANHPGLVPGKNKVTLIDVPRGTHQYAVRLHPSSEGKSAAVRFTIPSQALRNSGGRARS